MNLIYYPGNILIAPTSPIITFDSALDRTLKEMYDIMIANSGVGLSMNQVGISSSGFIMKQDDGFKEFINPVITFTEGSVVMTEGCLSFPGAFVQLTRPEFATITAQDKYGEEFKVALEGLEARIALHEIDHLLGEVFLSKVNRHQRKAALKEMSKYVRS